MKLVLGIVAVAVLGVGLYLFSAGNTEVQTPAVAEDNTALSEATAETAAATNERSVVTDGSYEVITEESTINWAGKKPLLEGYINTGSFALTEGTVEVADGVATGMFTIDMNTLSVSKTPTKPGSESKLEEHLMGERWFNVAEFPTASFVITKVTPRADSDTTLTYDVEGDLTLKGVTDSVAFPATIYLDETDRVHAVADFEFDRTKWGITSGSGSFFDGLADNVIDDMVALSFHLVAEKQ